MVGGGFEDGWRMIGGCKRRVGEWKRVGEWLDEWTVN